MRKAHSIEAGKIASNGTRFYLVRWEGQSDPRQFTWVPETEFEPDSQIVERFLSSNLALFADNSTQTDDSTWIINPISITEEYDYFKRYVPKTKTTSKENETDLLPTNIINYDPSSGTFEVTFADKPQSKWIESEILLSLAPELIAKYFIDSEMMKTH